MHCLKQTQALLEVICWVSSFLKLELRCSLFDQWCVLIRSSRCALFRVSILSQAKVNNQGQIGLAYSQNLRTGVKLSLSGLIEGRNINAGGHKLGVALDFES